jgi:hypothetical protein
MQSYDTYFTDSEKEVEVAQDEKASRDQSRNARREEKARLEKYSIAKQKRVCRPVFVSCRHYYIGIEPWLEQWRHVLLCVTTKYTAERPTSR